MLQAILQVRFEARDTSMAISRLICIHYPGCLGLQHSDPSLRGCGEKVSAAAGTNRPPLTRAIR